MLLRHGVAALVGVALVLVSGCAGSRNKMAGDPLLGDYVPPSIKARSSPQATAAANGKVPPIPKTDLNMSNAGLAQDPLMGTTGLERSVAQQYQDAWQGQPRTNGVPTVQPLPRAEQMPSPQIVPTAPQSGTTSGWQRTPGRDPYADYTDFMQKTTAAEAERLRNGVQQVQNNLNTGVTQLQQSTINPLAERADAMRQTAGSEMTRLGNGVQDLTQNVTATASQVQQNTINRMEAIRNATATEFAKLKNGAVQVQDNIATTAAQFQQNALNMLGQQTATVKNTTALEYQNFNNNVQQVQSNVQQLQSAAVNQSSQMADYLQAELKTFGVLWQKSENVPDGVRFSCIVPRRDNPTSNQVFEATASDYPSALRAVVEQIKGR